MTLPTPVDPLIRISRFERVARSLKYLTLFVASLAVFAVDGGDPEVGLPMSLGKLFASFALVSIVTSIGALLGRYRWELVLLPLQVLGCLGMSAVAASRSGGIEDSANLLALLFLIISLSQLTRLVSLFVFVRGMSEWSGFKQPPSS